MPASLAFSKVFPNTYLQFQSVILMFHKSESSIRRLMLFHKHWKSSRSISKSIRGYRERKGSLKIRLICLTDWHSLFILRCNLFLYLFNLILQTVPNFFKFSFDWSAHFVGTQTINSLHFFSINFWFQFNCFRQFETSSSFPHHLIYHMDFINLRCIYHHIFFE